MTLTSITHKRDRRFSFSTPTRESLRKKKAADLFFLFRHSCFLFLSCAGSSGGIFAFFQSQPFLFLLCSAEKFNQAKVGWGLREERYHDSGRLRIVGSPFAKCPWPIWTEAICRSSMIPIGLVLFLRLLTYELLPSCVCCCCCDSDRARSSTFASTLERPDVRPCDPKMYQHTATTLDCNLAHPAIILLHESSCACQDVTSCRGRCEEYVAQLDRSKSSLNVVEFHDTMSMTRMSQLSHRVSTFACIRSARLTQCVRNPT